VPALIEKLLRERDPVTRDLANVCLQCLMLGFYGRLRGNGGLAQHEEWRRELFAFAYQRDADLRQLGVQLERPSAVAPLRLTIRNMLPDGFRLGMVVAAMVAVMLLIGHGFWLDIESRLSPLLFQPDGNGRGR
jgi:type VI secretion system protein ImpK